MLKRHSKSHNASNLETRKTRCFTNPKHRVRPYGHHLDVGTAKEVVEKTVLEQILWDLETGGRDWVRRHCLIILEEVV